MKGEGPSSFFLARDLLMQSLCQGLSRELFSRGGIKSLRYEFMSNISLGLFFFEKNACYLMQCSVICIQEQNKGDKHEKHYN
jgi:hypothetical protein